MGGIVLNGDTEYITFASNLAHPIIIPSVTLPGAGVAVKRKSIKKIDIHFTFKIEYNSDVQGEDIYTVIDMDVIKRGINVQSLSWDEYASSFVQIQALTFNEGAFGRSGLKFSNEGRFDRSYTSDLLVGGSWPIQNKTIFQPGSIFTVDVYGADYS